MQCRTRGIALAVVLSLACLTSAAFALSIPDVLVVGDLMADNVRRRPVVGTPLGPYPVSKTKVTTTVSLAEVRTKLPSEEVASEMEEVIDEHVGGVGEDLSREDVFTNGDKESEDETSAVASSAVEEYTEDIRSENHETAADMIQTDQTSSSSNTERSFDYLSITAVVVATLTVCFFAANVFCGAVFYIFEFVVGGVVATVGEVSELWASAWAGVMKRQSKDAIDEPKHGRGNIVNRRGTRRRAVVDETETLNLSKTKVSKRGRGRVVSSSVVRVGDDTRKGGDDGHVHNPPPSLRELKSPGGDVKTPPPRRSTRLSKSAARVSPTSHFSPGDSSASAGDSEDDGNIGVHVETWRQQIAGILSVVQQQRRVS